MDSVAARIELVESWKSDGRQYFSLMNIQIGFHGWYYDVCYSCNWCCIWP